MSIRTGSQYQPAHGSVIGREAELAALDTVLVTARQGLAALVFEGEPGIGKTTLWREGISRASSQGYRVLSCRAVPAEARLSFASLGDLLAPIEDAALACLPVPQRRALDAALLRAEPEGTAPDPRAIGTGVVSLVSSLAADAPVLLAIDDLQWLDVPSARTLEFALRRLEARSVAVVATVRKGETGIRNRLLTTLASQHVWRLDLGPLSIDTLHRILEEQLDSRLSRPLLVKIADATRGNPFYALEITRAVKAANWTSTDVLPVPDDLRKVVGLRLRKLPHQTRDALLRVSALAVPTVELVDPKSLALAEEADVAHVRADARIEFAHPMFARAVYAAASHERRRRLHAGLANAVTDVEERARHLMLAGQGADADVADALDEAAEHAHRRGAPDVAAELAEQAARRTPLESSLVRGQRCLRAARHHLKAGDPGKARLLGEEVLGASPPPPLRAHALHMLAEIRIEQSMDGAIQLLEQALACAGDDYAHAAQLEVANGVIRIAVLDLRRAAAHLARAVELAERSEDTALLAQAIALNELARLFSGLGVDEGALQRALALEDADRVVPFQMRPSINVAQTYEFIGRLGEARQIFVTLFERITARGEEADLEWVLIHLTQTSWLAGNFELAEDEADQALRAARLTGQDLFVAFALLLRSMIRALRGDRGRARSDGIEAMAASERIGWAIGVGQSRYGLGFLALSDGNPREALAFLEPVVALTEALGVYEWATAMEVPDAVEALVATGDVERAERLTDALSAWGRDYDRPWALATSGRCRALLEAAAGHLDAACAAAERALIEHQRLPMPFERGRTQLVLGQLQRRRGERRVARETLQRALTTFEVLEARSGPRKRGMRSAGSVSAVRRTT